MDGKKGGGKGRGFERYFGKGGRPQGDRPQGDRPQGDRPQGGYSRGGKPGGKPGDGRRYFEKDARPENGRRPYDRDGKPGENRPGAPRDGRSSRPYREDGRYDKGPGPRFSKAPERPVPPAVFDDGPRAKPEAPRDSRPEDRRYGKPYRPGGGDRTGSRPATGDAPRYARPVPEGAPRFDKPDSDRPAPRFGRPAPKFDRPAPRYGKPVPNSERPEPRYGKPVPESDRPGPRYGKPTPRFDEPAPAAPEDAGAETVDVDNLLVGRNPIREALKSGMSIEKMLVAQGELSGSARELVAKAREAGVVVQFVDRARLDQVYPNHQGMLAYASAAAYSSVDDILALAAKKDEAPFIVALDGVTDPHNLGAIIRTAECCGAHGVIVPERRSAGLNPAAVKASAGALSYLPVARVGNLSRTLADLKEKGLWVIGCDTSGSDIRESDLTGPVVLVIGSEGEGISRLVLEGCDRVISIPLKGRISSLNASVAAGIALYEVMRTRSGQ